MKGMISRKNSVIKIRILIILLLVSNVESLWGHFFGRRGRQGDAKIAKILCGLCASPRPLRPSLARDYYLSNPYFGLLANYSTILA